MLVPRYYQTECISAIYDYFGKAQGNPIAALPTGTGKSVIIADFVKGMLCRWPQQRMMMLTHVKELIRQNYDELMEHWPMAPAGIFSAGLNRKEVRPITFAGIKSVLGRESFFGHVDIIIIDECHLVSPKDDTAYQQFIGALKLINPKIKVIGLTATPYRLGQGMLTSTYTKGNTVKLPLFTDICYDITGLNAFNRLIDEGFLAPLVPKHTNTQLDLSGVHIVGGEFVASELQDAVDKDDITFNALHEVIREGQGRKHWLIFGTGVQHCEHITAALELLGVPAHCVHSGTSSEERATKIADFKAGRVRALVGNNIFTTGFNFRPIDLIVILRPTSSPSLWVQMLGRGTRPSPETGKVNCLVLDFAGNTRRLGPINDPVLPRARKSGSGGGGAPVRLCPLCSTYSHASKRACEKCGNPFPAGEINISNTAATEELIRTSPQIEVVSFKVDSINYRKFSPNRFSGKPPHLRVEYFCGLRQFSDLVCLEHEGFASKKARDWWREMAGDTQTEPPQTVEDALRQIETLNKPTHIKVWENTKYPRVMAYDFSGTNFGETYKQN